GSYKQFINLEQEPNSIRLLQRITFHPEMPEIATSNDENISLFKNQMKFIFKNSSNGNIVLECDYNLYSLLKKVRNGYIPTKSDEEDAVKFVEFLEKLMSTGNKKKELLLDFVKSRKKFI